LLSQSIPFTSLVSLFSLTHTVVAVGAVPVVLGAAGFTSAGIGAGTLAAKAMSATAIANGGGVAAGSFVAVLQSVGKKALTSQARGPGFDSRKAKCWTGFHTPHACVYLSVSRNLVVY
uniref:Uncharacterized protein n=1 Tax=Callorhinchus milii TaxID=7868 RepID=A0A4W3GLM8_CALMI